MNGFDFEKFKKLYQQQIDKKENFDTEKFLKENRKKLEEFEKIKEKNKPTIFSDDNYGV